MSKKRAAPFAPIHRDYEDSLEAVLLAYGALENTIQTLMDLKQIPDSVRPRVAKCLADIRVAWDGDGQ